MHLENKSVLVTGAGRGIGQAIAIEFARTGADVIGVDLRREDLATTEQAVTQHGRRFIGFACDIGVESQVRELMSKG